MFKYLKVMVKIILIFLLLSCSKDELPQNDKKVPHWQMEVVSGSKKPVIGKDHPACFDNVGGFENGSVVKLDDGSYHMVITELFKYGGALSGVWEPARLGHWKSEDQGDSWSRLGTIETGSNIDGDPKKHTWSAQWFYDSAKEK